MPVETTEQNSDTADDRPSAPLDAAEVDRRIDEHERRIADQQGKQFQLLKDEARALFGMLDGRPGVTSRANLAKALEKAGDEIGNGRFLVQYLGAERYLDVGTVAVLITLRQNLIAELGRPTTADIMMIDAAVIGYFNLLRVQGWIGNLALAFEREAFGQTSLNEIHGPTVGEQLREQLERLSEVILPLQDRAHRMMIRSLAQLSLNAQ